MTEKREAATEEKGGHEWQQPVEISTKPHLRPDGEFVQITIKQGESEIQLTSEQAQSLAVSLKVFLP